ncbi:MAG: hypothetical protein PG980_000809 [Wolbachia endosymbiont of Ctenocephalides felis wCfeJ]|nr:MAG: hypothetical protein PG980_000809 [Wolbachia endosymbiont of Ctenocephalides felis wCfeJ]
MYQIDFCREQQEAYLHLSQFVSNNFQDASIQPVKQSLYSPSFEELGIKMDGKCTAVTRGFSQGLFPNQHKLLSNNTSARLYEHVAQGKQVSKKEALAFSKLFDGFKQQLDSRMSSLPSNLICTKGYKTLGDLSNYITGVKGDFAIHLVTNNHVVAIYRTGDNYAYFDCNTAFVSGLKSVDQLMQVVKKGVKSAKHKVGKKGFLVEHFDVDRANSQLSSKGNELTASDGQQKSQSLEATDKANNNPVSYLNGITISDQLERSINH